MFLWIRQCGNHMEDQNKNLSIHGQLIRKQDTKVIPQKNKFFDIVILQVKLLSAMLAFHKDSSFCPGFSSSLLMYLGKQKAEGILGPIHPHRRLIKLLTPGFNLV